MLWPLGPYALVSLALYGVPVVGHLGSRIIASDEIDSSQFMWFLAWWPHAILHGLNPVVTRVMFVPQGFNLAWATSIPLPSVLLSPLTLAFGPAVSWNIMQLAAPPLSAWTAFLLCRHITGRTWPSLVGGYVFGFSPYMVFHLTGGPNATLVPLIPIFVLLVLRRIEGSLSQRRFVVAMTLVLSAQYLISSEALATSTLFGAAALAVALVLFGDRRRALARVGRELVAAYACAAVLVSPFLYFFFFGHHYPPGRTGFSAALANFVLPAPLLGHTDVLGLSYRGANAQSYLGLPLLAAVLAFAWMQRRKRSTWLVVGCMLIAAVASLGDHFTVRGATSLSAPAPGGTWLPWSLATHLPVLRYATPLRFSVFVLLPAAMIVAMWLERGGAARWAIALLVVVSFVPDIGNAAWQTRISDPAFFRNAAYRGYLTPADRVLTVPAWGPNERWQADTGFAFKLAAGYLGNPFPPSYTRYPTWNTLVSGQLTADFAPQLRHFVEDKGVTVIVVDSREPGPWQTLFATLGVPPRATGGVLVYRLRPPAG